MIYLVPAYPWIAVPGAPTPGTPAAPPAEMPAAPVTPPTGTLRLELDPLAPSQVFVDGEFVGSASDHGHRLVLAAGAHHIELREPGFETLRFDVRIEAGHAITYRGRLAPAPSGARPEVPATLIPRKPFYAIDGCYFGDVPPADAKLPASCDPAKATVYWP